MNKKELANKTQEKVGGTKKLAEQYVDAILESMKETLASGESIKLVGDFSIEIKEKKSRKGRNPQTGEEIMIAASKGFKFKAGKTWVDAVKGVVEG